MLARCECLGDAVLPTPVALMDRLRNSETVFQDGPDFAGEPLRMVLVPIEIEGRFAYGLQVATFSRSTRDFLVTARLTFINGFHIPARGTKSGGWSRR